MKLSKHIFFSLLLFFLIGLGESKAQGLPDGFTDVVHSGGWNRIVGVDFDENGGMYAWEKGGKVYRVENGEKQEPPLLDISEEVGDWRDHGLLGFVLDPDFLENGHFYVYYAVDLHYLKYFGTSRYSPDSTITNQATMGRICRYTASKADSFRSVISGSRKVLIGEDISSGIPILLDSHDGGTLLFGTDGSLLVSTGDGASHKAADLGGDISYAPQAIREGIIPEEQDVGAYRSQQLQSLNGKILRIDPQTGDGVPGNPFYDPAEPRANASRVYALGLRNPFRMCLEPGSGSHYPNEGKPGRLFVGDVGSYSWEEINVIDHGATNLGWPMFEGFDTIWIWKYPKENPYAPNPFYRSGQCKFPNFTFQQILHQSLADSSHDFLNPCDPTARIEEHHPVFYNQPPILAWNNPLNPPTRTAVPAYDGEGKLYGYDLHRENAPAVSDTFKGPCVGSVLVYEGENFPEAYRGKLFFGDCVDHWIRMADYDSVTGALTKIEMFQPYAKGVVDMKVNPLDGCMYYVSFAGKIRKICFGGNAPPQAVASADTFYGPSPLQVQFEGDQSFDPQGQPISYHWDFGNGESSTEANPSVTFRADTDGPQAFPVRFTVTDSLGLSSQVELVISLNNTPPEVQISSFDDGDLYSVTELTRLPLEAEVYDAEHEPEELHYAWQVFLHHNTHFHPEPIDTLASTVALITPIGCEAETYYYRIRLTVTDEAGLSTQQEQYIYPYCGPPIVEFADLRGKALENHIELQWNTLHETRLKYLEIDRYEPGKGYLPLGRLDAAGDHIGKLSYRFTDDEPLQGRNRYQLKAVSEEGVYAYSTEISFDFPPRTDIFVYPNPARNRMFVNFHLIDERASLLLRDALGRTVLSRSWDESGEGLQEISLESLQPGLYFYVIDSGVATKEGKLIRLK